MRARWLMALVLVACTPPNEAELGRDFARVDEEVRTITDHIANGRYDGPLPPEDALARLRTARAELERLDARHEHIPPEARRDHTLDMRFFSLRKSGFPSLDANIRLLEHEAKQAR